MSKKRLDSLVKDLHPEYSRAQIHSWIMQGKVSVDGTIITKPGTNIAPDAQIILTVEIPRFVSRAGYKLEHALKTFSIDVTGLIALDAGISTGGFTDCLLQHGIARVYGIDVGYGQVHEKVRNDPRVIVLERTNLRTLDPQQLAPAHKQADQQVEKAENTQFIDLITLDLSFISVLKVMPVIQKLLKTEGKLIVLIKPQFEAGRKDVGKGGIIKDPQVHERVLASVTSGIKDYGFTLVGTTPSPIEGSSGNKEFLAYFIKK